MKVLKRITLLTRLNTWNAMCFHYFFLERELTPFLQSIQAKDMNGVGLGRARDRDRALHFSADSGRPDDTSYFFLVDPDLDFIFLRGLCEPKFPDPDPTRPV